MRLIFLYTGPTRSTSCFPCSVCCICDLAPSWPGKIWWNAAWCMRWSIQFDVKKAPSPFVLRVCFPHFQNPLVIPLDLCCCSMLDFVFFLGGGSYFFHSIFGVFGIIKCLLFLLVIPTDDEAIANRITIWTFPTHSVGMVHIYLYLINLHGKFGYM